MPRRHRIALVVHAVASDDPRIRRQVDALRSAGHEVDVFGLRRPGEAAEDWREGVRMIRLPVNRWFTGLAGHMAEYVAFSGIVLVRLAQEHRRRHYDLVQVATVPDFLAFSAIPERLVGVPLLLDLHEDMPEFYRDRFGASWQRPFLPLVDIASRASAAVSTELITVHEPLRRLSIARGVAPDRIGVVMNSADPQLFDPARHPQRSYMADGVLRLIHHSNLQRIYGLDIAVRAVSSLADVPLVLDVYGDGPWRGEVERVIEETGTRDRVILHGRVPLDALPGLLAGADVGLVPTRPGRYAQYSLSTKLLELAAMGVPTIASDLTTFRTYFSDAALRYVPAGDVDALAKAIREAAVDHVEMRARGVEATRQAAALDWNHQRVTYLETVERLIARRVPVST
jgi:glycosyltransferase involved in cell wall biosynthesis